jgi:hypothetical protein
MVSKKTKLDMFKSTCAIWLSGQINNTSKLLIFGLVFQSNKPWFLVTSTKVTFFFNMWKHLGKKVYIPPMSLHCISFMFFSCGISASYNGHKYHCEESLHTFRLKDMQCTKFIQGWNYYVICSNKLRSDSMENNESPKGTYHIVCPLI